MRKLSAAAAILLLSGGLASAQDASTAQPDAAAAGAASADVLVPLENEEAPVPSLNLMAGQVAEMDVVGADNAEIGEVENVLGGPDGKASAITIDVGGFLGVGEKTVILMLSDVTLEMGRLRTALTKSQIEDLPDYSG